MAKLTWDDVEQKLSDLGFKVSNWQSNGNSYSCDIQKYSPAGQDCNFTLEMEKDNPSSVAKALDELWENYDPDAETMLWVGPDGHGKNGAPYRLSDILSDMEAVEKDLENALAKNVTEFLLELGQGFAYLGRQKELRIDEENVFFPDLLFYHIPQRRYVIVELKAVKFMPEFAGKLNFYVTAADKLLRGKDDNPSVGLLICKTAKKTIVEWSLQDIQKPLGVASYQLQEVVERTIAELENKKKHDDEEV